MEIIEMTLVEVQKLCAENEQFRREFEKWWNDFKRRHNVLAIHH